MIKKIFFIVFILLAHLTSKAQILTSSTGYFADYGTANNSQGFGWWYIGPIDSATSIMYESANALVIQGSNIPVNNSFLFQIGIGQSFAINNPINLSDPANMVVKVRLKNTGSVMPNSITINIGDNLGRYTACDVCYMTFNPTNQFADYFFNINGRWKQTDGVQSPTIVDSTSVTSITFFIDYMNTAIDNQSDIGLEIDYIQIGSYVNWEHNLIKGKAFNDYDKNCSFNGSDLPIARALIEATPGPYYAYTDAEGNYELKVDTGVKTFTIKHSMSSVQQSLLQFSCTSNNKITLTTNSTQTEYCCNDFAEKSTPCSILKIDVASNRRRRCFRNVTTVNYRNDGNIAANNTLVKIVYPEYVIPISSTPAWTHKENNILYYQVGVVNANALATIKIIDSVVCGDESIRGLTQCTEAYISPANSCLPNNPLWDESDITVTGKCSKGTTNFTISNVGIGNMTDSSQYRVFMNDTLVLTKKFKLPSNEYFYVSLPSGGNTIRVEADQHPLHPGYSTPRYTLEACVASNLELATVPRGLVMNTPPNDKNDEVSISCLQIIDSYDPNDKQVTPVGKTNNHYVLAGTELKYTIRFENTGSDTAYTVVVQDTLDANLDFSSFNAGASSHSYQTEIINVNGQNIVKFRFANINLVPKATDAILCQGYVQFSINALPSLADGTTLSNQAGIYFDYNSAIITNEVSHTIGDYVEVDYDRGKTISQSENYVLYQPVTEPKLYPNPVKTEFTVEIPAGMENAEISIYASNNSLVLKQKIVTGNKTILNLQYLQEGIYFYHIIDSKGNKSTGRIMKVNNNN